MRVMLPFLLLTFLSCKEKPGNLSSSKHMVDTVPVIIRSGIPEVELIKQMNFTARRYGFRYKGVSCAKGILQADSISNANALAYALLDKRLGKEWRSVYFQELETAGQIRAFIHQALMGNFDGFPEPVYILVMPGWKRGQYLAEIYTFDPDDEQGQSHSLIYVGLDFNKKKGIEVWRSAQERAAY